ncbi:MAG: hypothetical protein A2Y20_04095 [Firmicutes bacterium GWF2_51_9]|nr:MAG: hypothetical protein A2Y20_04095 [Firmicutes bacterium GWF2_51_9]OGS59610.1 MAG: hypothetical protein A2Y19_01675 [Firmicutes bacterium GWE2_51_13]HBZ41626.1 hypothetical protein [Erysipelotrichaceae bacterium]
MVNETGQINVKKLEVNEFIQAFNKKVDSNLNNDNGRDNYHKKGFCTNVMKEEIIGKVLINLGFSLFNGKPKDESYRTGVDYFGFEQKSYDISTWHYNGHHDWILTSIIEHENDGKDWLDEYQKLLRTNCPQKILITYGQRTVNDGGIKDKGVELIVKAQQMRKQFEIFNGCRSANINVLFGPTLKELNKAKRIEFHHYVI